MKRLKVMLMAFALIPFMALAETIGEGLNCLSLTWTTGGVQSRADENVNWSYDAGDSYSDGACVTSGAGGWGDAISWLKTTVVGPCRISFRYKVQTYNGSFTVYCDSSTLYNYTGVTGTSPSWQYAEYDISSGSHEIKFRYHHPGMGYAYEFNGARVDEFTVTYNHTLASALGVDGLTVTTGGSADWFVQSEEKHDEQDAVRSGAIGNSQSSWMQTTITGAKQVSFWWKVSSESNYDFLKFYVDGVEKKSISGTGGNWSQETVQVTGTGAHTLKWQYSKDGSQSSGSDCGWVDQLVISDAPVRPGTTYYVNGTTGSDSNTGLSTSAAKKTIQAAIDVATEGSTIRVAAGTYRGRLEISRCITLWGVDGPVSTIIQGSSGNTVVHIASDATGSTVRGFTITGGTGRPSSSSYGYDYYGGGVCCDTTANIRDCIIHGNGHGTPRQSSGTFGGGLCGRLTVTNCLLYDNYAWASGGATFVEGGTMELNQCTIYGNDSTDFFGYQGGVGMANNGKIVAKNCIVWNNGGNEIDAYSSPYNSGTSANVAYCCVDGGVRANHIASLTSGDGNISVSPNFANVSNYDFSLCPGSPCIGSGEGGCDMGFSLTRINGKLEDGLVAWYKFDGDATDSSGNGHDLGIAGSPALVEDRFGTVGSAYSFIGDDAQRMYPLMEPSIVAERSFSFSLWFKTGVSYSDYGAGWAWNLGNYAFFPKHGGDDGGAGLGVKVGIDGVEVVEHAGFYMPTVLSYTADLGVGWNLVTVTVEDNGAPQLYLNGVWVAEGEISGKVKCVGTEVGGGDWGYYTGCVDDVRIYSRALSAAEVNAIYNEGNDDPTVYHVVTFNANGGTAVSSRRVEDGAVVGTLPTATKNGAEFLGWFTAATGGTQVTATRTITEDVTFYAHWREIPLSDAIGGGAYVITTGGDGNWFAESANKVEGAYAAQSGVIGDGQSSWMQTTVTGANEVSFKWMVSSEEEYDWLKVYVDGDEKDAISGSASWREKTLSITGDGAHVIKWVYSKDGSVSNGDDCGRVDALTVTPIITPPPVVEWTVTFNANGGTASFAEKLVTDGQSVGTLPDAEREGFDFDGWYTVALGGSEVTAATVVTADVEYFAHWRSVEVVPTYGPWGESSAVKNPDKLGPTYLQNMSVTIYGTPAEEGDVVAVYREDTDALCGLGKVMDESGRVTLVYYAPKGTILTFKVWLGASGVTNPTILDCDATCNLVAPDVGLFYSGHALRVTDDESLTITLADEDWHCISFNVAPDDASPSVVFGDVANKIAAVTQGIDFWMPGQPSSLKKIEIGKGYWVKTTAENVSWTVYGKTVPDTEIELEAGWNLVGYAGERSGRIAQVLRTAIADGVVAYITCGIEFYPGGTLTTMEPGKAYWIYANAPYTLKYDAPRALMMAKAMAVGNAAALTAGSEPVPTYGPWGESDAVKNPDKLASTMLLGMPLTFDGEDAEEGDVVAAYRQDTGALCGLGKVLNDSGTLTMVCYAPKGVTLHFKAWVAASGVNEPQIFDCDDDCDLIAPDAGAFVTEHELVVSSLAEVLTVVPGAKVDIDTGLVDYAVKGLPNGLKYDKKSGRITGSATKPTGAEGVEVSFTSCCALPTTLTIVVAPIPKISIAMVGDTDGCKTTGDGAYLVGKKASLSATAPKGTAFIGWFSEGEPWPNASDSAKAKLSYEMTAEDVSLVAKFEKEKMSVACAGLSYGTFVAGVAGSAGGIPLEIETQSGVKSVAVKFTPSCGLTYDAKKQLITGAPTKTGEVKAEIAVTSVSGAVEKKTISFYVAALPDMAVGTFNGFVGKTANDEFTGHGTFSLTSTDAGKLTAKITDATGSYSFSAANWDSVAVGVCTAKLSTKKGEVLNLSLDTTAAWNAYQLTGTFAAGGKTYEVSAQRKAFGTPWYFTATGNAENGWTLGYSANAKDAVLTVTMKADGTATLAGTLGGNKISAAGFVDVSGLTNGVLFADFVPVVSVKTGKSTVKKSMYIRTNLWFDKKSDHENGVGSAVFVD